MTKRLFVLLLAVSALFLSACSLSTGLLTTTAITLDTTATTNPASTTATTGAATSTTTNVPTTATTVTEAEIDPFYAALFDNYNYHKFVISFSRANFDKLIYDMQNYRDQWGTYRDNTIQEVDIYYEDGDGNIITEYEVGFRTRGNIFSRVLPVVYDDEGHFLGYQQVSFQLEFNDTFDYPYNSTEYKALKDRRMFDLEQLNFKYIRSNDTAAVTEIAANELYRAAGLIAPETSLCVIYFDIDGEVIPYGLFTVVEPIDDVFVKRYFGRNQDGTIGDLYKCVWQSGGPATLQTLQPSQYDRTYPDRLGVSDYTEGYRMDYQLKTNKANSDFSAMLNFMDVLNDPGAINFQSELEKVLDVDSWLKALAVAFLVGNPDDYRSDANNYYLYFSEGNEPNQKAVYITYDNDQCLGYGWNPYGDYGLGNDIYSMGTSQPWNMSEEDLPLVHNLLAIPAYQEIYESYLLAFIDSDGGIFDYGSFEMEFILAQYLYADEITANGVLGLTTLDLEQRFMTAEDYYAAKIQMTRASINSYHN